MTEIVIDGCGTLWVIYWSHGAPNDEATWLVPGTIDPLDD